MTPNRVRLADDPRVRTWAPWVSLVVRVALAGILIWAGLAKLLHPLVAIQAVSAYQLLPDVLVPIVGYGLPLFEVVLGLFLLVGLGTGPAAMVTGLLMVVFIAGVASAWARGLSIDCGCFGGGGQVAPGETQYVQEILRDCGFIALAAWLVIFPRSRWSLDGRYSRLDDLDDGDLDDDDLDDNDFDDDDLDDDESMERTTN